VFVVVDIVRLKLTVSPPVRVTLLGFPDRIGPLLTRASTLYARFIVPLKVPLATEITDTPLTPGFTHKFIGVAPK
jgi:hypothetical protein